MDRSTQMTHQSQKNSTNNGKQLLCMFPHLSYS